MKQFVSIIIPVYNAESSLARCLTSVLGQSYRQFELIVINDGSTDGSQVIIEQFCEDDQRIRAFVTENRGVSQARNRGIDEAAGCCLLFLDADDWLEPDALEIMVTARTAHGADLIISNYYNNSESVKSCFNPPVYENRLIEREELLEYIRGFFTQGTGRSTFIYIWAKLFDLEKIKKQKIRFDGDLKVAEDMKFNFEYLQHVEQIYYIHKPLYHYRVTDKPTAGSSIIDYPLSYLASYAAIKDLFREQDIAAEMGHWIIHFAIRVIFQLVKMADSQELTVTEKKLVNQTKKVIHDPLIRENLKQYNPAPGDSTLVFMMMRAKQVRLAIWACRLILARRSR